MSSQRDTPAGHRAGWRLQQSYREGLPAIFYTQTAPTPVNRPGLALFNVELAGDLGLDPDHFEEPAGAAELTGNTLPQGAEPLAQAYPAHATVVHPAQETQIAEGNGARLPAMEQVDGQWRHRGHQSYQNDRIEELHELWTHATPPVSEPGSSTAAHGQGSGTRTGTASVAISWKPGGLLLRP